MAAVRQDNEQGQHAGSSEVVEQAKLELNARYGFLLDEAFEVLCGLARSQRCSVEEFACAVVESGGRLDGDRGSDSRAGNLVPELVVEVPSAVSAFVLAGSLADFGARAVLEEDTWQVVVDRCSSFSAGTLGVLSRTKSWMAEWGLASASVRLDGKAYLLEASAGGVGR
jgi:hypothetical protein